MSTLVWPADLCFMRTLVAVLARASAQFSRLAQLVTSKAIPLTAAVELVEAKVDALGTQMAESSQRRQGPLCASSVEEGS